MMMLPIYWLHFLVPLLPGGEFLLRVLSLVIGGYHCHTVIIPLATLALLATGVPASLFVFSDKPLSNSEVRRWNKIGTIRRFWRGRVA